MWLKVNNLSSSFGMELLESILTTHSKFFIENQVFLELLKDKIIPLVVKCFKINKPFPVILRILRLLDCIIKHFAVYTASECEVFLCKLIRILQSPSPSPSSHFAPIWINALILEIFSNYFLNPELIIIFYENYDMNVNNQAFNIPSSNNPSSLSSSLVDPSVSTGESKILQNLLITIGQYIQFYSTNNEYIKLYQSSSAGSSSGSSDSSNESKQSKKPNNQAYHSLATNTTAGIHLNHIKLMELLNHTDPPSCVDILFVRNLSIECLCNLIQSLYKLTLFPTFQTVAQPSDKSPDNESQANGNDKGVEGRINQISSNLCNISSLCNAIWPSMLSSLSILFTKIQNENQMGIILNSFKLFIKISCLLGLETPRDAFITEVTKVTFPKEKDMNFLNRKNLLAMKTLIKIARNFGNLLTTGWRLILINTYSLYIITNSPQLQQLIQLQESGSFLFLIFQIF